MCSLTHIAPQPFPDRNLPPVKVGTGARVFSAAGRPLSPVPRIDITSDRRCNSSLKRLDAWLHDEARSEARFRQDGFNGLLFRGMQPEALSQADRDALNLYLFANIRGITADLVCRAKG